MLSGAIEINLLPNYRKSTGYESGSTALVFNFIKIVKDKIDSNENSSTG